MASGTISRRRNVVVSAKEFYIPANASSVSVTANAVANCKFVCWVQASSVGWVGLVYPDFAENETTNFWTTESASSQRKVHAVALYVTTP